MSGYVWYSYGSDKTGPVLAKALGFQCGKKTPQFSHYDIVVGWGCKPGTKYNPTALAKLVSNRKVRLINHVDMVDANRDKLGILKSLNDAGIPVPGFCVFAPGAPKKAYQEIIPHAVRNGSLGYPLLLCNSQSRGDPAICYSPTDVGRALKGNSGRDHPFNFARTMDQGDHLRIHVFRDVAMFAQQKVMAKDPIAAATASLMKKATRNIEREKKRKISAAETIAITGVVQGLAGEILQSSSQLRKSSSLGWTLEEADLKVIPPEVIGTAIGAIDAAHLDMGAVSVSIEEGGVPRVLSITTAPSLDEHQMARYVAEISDFYKAAPAEKEDISPPKTTSVSSSPTPELTKRVTERLRSLSKERLEGILKFLEN